MISRLMSASDMVSLQRLVNKCREKKLMFSIDFAPNWTDSADSWEVSVSGDGVFEASFEDLDSLDGAINDVMEKLK